MKGITIFVKESVIADCYKSTDGLTVYIHKKDGEGNAYSVYKHPYYGFMMIMLPAHSLLRLGSYKIAKNFVRGAKSFAKKKDSIEAKVRTYAKH